MLPFPLPFLSEFYLCPDGPKPVPLLPSTTAAISLIFLQRFPSMTDVLYCPRFVLHCHAYDHLPVVNLVSVFLLLIVCPQVLFVMYFCCYVHRADVCSVRPCYHEGPSRTPLHYRLSIRYFLSCNICTS